MDVNVGQLGEGGGRVTGDGDDVHSFCADPAGGIDEFVGFSTGGEADEDIASC